jgi:hypothetical protein
LTDSLNIIFRFLGRNYIAVFSPFLGPSEAKEQATCLLCYSTANSLAYNVLWLFKVE